jgi:Mg2+-importing ATPase
VRGSAQDVISCCVRIDPAQHAALDAWLSLEGKKGTRIIAIARKTFADIDTSLISAKAEEHAMELVGLIAFEDPLKQTARSAIEKARHLGVQIKILSGDSVEVCAAIGSKVGLIKSPMQVISGEYFMQHTHEQKMKLVENGIVFARVTPHQKYEIIQLLQEKYKVGYMGDGINDAPALKIAHVALAVDDAADIAREAADIILLQRSLRVIINGIEEGRIIFANTLKFLKITLAAGFGHFYALAIASLLIDFLPMLPVQLLVLNFMTDMPLIALSTDTISEAEVRSPQKYDFKAIIIIATILGLVITTFDFMVFGLFLHREPAVLQTNWFMSCMLNEIAFSFSARSSVPFYKAKAPSKMLAIFSLLVACIAVILPFTYFGQRWLHFVPPSVHDLVLIFTLMIGCFIATEWVKMLYYRLYKNYGA